MRRTFRSITEFSSHCVLAVLRSLEAKKYLHSLISAMTRFSKIAAASVLATTAYAQCGSAPDATVDGTEGAYTATVGGSEVYSGSDYYTAITEALGGISSGQTVSVIASGNIGAKTISIESGKTFEGCGTITASIANGKGAIESLNTQDVNIPYLKLAGEVYFGLHFYGTTGLSLGEIVCIFLIQS